MTVEGAEVYLELTPPRGVDGAPRKVGIEIEFSGLEEQEVADILAAEIGGTIAEAGPHELVVEETELGDIKVVLDTAFRDKATTPLAKWGLEKSRAVVPVEIVTDPIHPADLGQLDQLIHKLREAGALGSRDGVLLGFGTHLNPALAGTEVGDVLPVLRAFALLEDWLRDAEPIDQSRRVLPFVDPYPRELVDALASDEAAHWSLDQMIDMYLSRAPSRNHALDLLPIIRHLDEDRLVNALGSDASSVSGRPAFHYRLPDSRIDEAGWSLVDMWNRWCLIEAVAGDPAFVAHLARTFREHRRGLTTVRADWVQRSGDMMDAWTIAKGLT